MSAPTLDDLARRLTGVIDVDLLIDVLLDHLRAYESSTEARLAALEGRSGRPTIDVLTNPDGGLSVLYVQGCEVFSHESEGQVQFVAKRLRAALGVE